jgi:CRISPR-associated endoribonuclease Cas6
MKSISITFNTPPVTIPINYHHQLQGLLYSLLSRSGGEALHNKSFDFGLRQYKLFTFSSLRGGKVTNTDQGNKSLHFERNAYLDVRSVRPEFCDAMMSGLDSGRTLALFGKPFSVRYVKTSDAHITESRLQIKMLSPLTLHKTDDNGYADYLNPLDTLFAEEMNRNFARKFYAFSGQMPSADISIRAQSIGAKDKYLTLYKKAAKPEEKDLYITGWRGEYELSGRPEHLTFLYYCGLGARNSDGFGMFEPI